MGHLRWLDGLSPRMQRTSCGPRRVPLPLELVPVVRRVEHDTAGAGDWWEAPGIGI